MDSAKNRTARIHPSSADGEQLFRTLTETTGSAIFVLREKFLYVNPAVETITGYSKKELLAMPSWEPLIHPDFRDLPRERAAARLRGEDIPNRGEIKIISKEGKERWIDYAAKKINYKGEVAVLGTAVDITERVHAEGALKNSEGKHRRIASNIPGVVYQFTKHKNGSFSIQYINGNMIALSGLPAEEVKRDCCKVLELLVPQDIQALTDSLEQSERTMNTWTHEFRINMFDGQVKWVRSSSTPVRLPNEDILWTGVMLDITERKQAEEGLRHSEERFSKIFQLSPAIICITTPEEGCFIDVNDTFLDVFGYERHEVIGKTSKVLGIWKDYAERAAIVDKLKAQGPLKDLELPFVSKDGKTLTLYGSVDITTIGDTSCLLMVAQDMTSRRYEEDVRRAREQRMLDQQDALLELATYEAINQGDLEGALKEITETAARTLDVARVGVWLYEGDRNRLCCVDQFNLSDRQHNSGDILLVKERPKYFNAVERDLVVTIDDVYESPLVREFPLGYLQDSGISSILSATIRLGGNSVGMLTHEHVGPKRNWSLEEQNFAASLAEMAALAVDQQQRRIAETELHREKEQAQVTLESIGDGVVTTDVDGRIEYINPVAEEFTGWKNVEVHGVPFQGAVRLIYEASRKPISNPIERCLHKGRTIRLSSQILLVNKDSGAEYSVEVIVSPIRNRERALIGSVLVFHDVTELRGMAKQLSFQASHDDLTGLINRREFEDRLAVCLRDTREKGGNHAVCYLDLDQFKVVNDTCGHIAGDELLKQLAAGLQPLMRKEDTLARLGGDEFGILLDGCGLNEAKEIADNVHHRIKEFRFVWEDQVFEIGVSIGLVEISAGSGSLTDVLSAADSACYVAKDQGRNRTHVFQPDDIAIAQRHGEMEWLQRINKAFEEKRFLLYYQIIQPLTEEAFATGNHCELLLRMADEKDGPILPQDFIAAAERYHFMPALDRWVVRTAFASLSSFDLQQEIGASIYTINLSGQSLGDDRFLDFVIEQLDKSGIDPSTICFEITETAAIANLTRANRFMTVLRGMGCRFALDDFGRGLSSFAYLKNLPVDCLKIDGGFVRDMPYDPIDYAMVEAINHIGHIMNIQTIAESVESDRILDLVRDIGVDYVQGSGLAKPLPMPIVLESPPVVDLSGN